VRPDRQTDARLTLIDNYVSGPTGFWCSVRGVIVAAISRHGAAAVSFRLHPSTLRIAELNRLPRLL